MFSETFGNGPCFHTWIEGKMELKKSLEIFANITEKGHTSRLSLNMFANYYHRIILQGNHRHI